MKIAVIRRECGSGSGGAEHYCAGLVRTLCQRGHRVTVIADSIDSCLMDSGAEFIRAPVSGRGSIMKNISYFTAVDGVLREHDFEFTLGLSRVRPVDMLRISDPLHAAWLELGYSGSTLSSLLRRFMPRHSCLLSLERKSIDSARHILANSNLVAAQVKHYYGVPPEKITTIYNGFDPKQFFPVSPEKKQETRKKLGLVGDGPVILFAGTNLGRKGFYYLIESLGMLANEYEFSLVAAGPEPDDSILSFVEKQGLAGRFVATGFVMDMTSYYQASDLFVLPTLYDPFANTCLEASACGIPVITTRENGASEILPRNASWLAVPGRNSRALAGAIAKFLDASPLEQASLGTLMVETVSDFTLENHVNRLLEVIEQRGDAAW